MLKPLTFICCGLCALGTAAGDFELAGGKVVVNDNFPNLSNVKSVCEGKTQIMQHAPGQLVLGGEAYSGEKVIAYIDGFALDDWCVMLENMTWSHDHAQGGHPTCVRLVDSSGNGYGMDFTGGKILLQKLAAGAEPQVLAGPFTTALPMTAARDLIMARNEAGTLYLSIGDVSCEVTGTPAIKVEKLEIEYAVFAWGYGMSMSKAFVKSFSGNSAAEYPVGSMLDGRKISILSNEAMLKAPERMGKPESMSAAYEAAGADVEIIAPGELAGAAEDSDLLIVFPDSIAADDVESLHEYALSGAPLLLSGGYGSEDVYVQKDGNWVIGDREEYSDTRQLLHWFIEYTYGCWMPLKTPLLDDGEIKLTDDGIRLLGNDFAGWKVPASHAIPLYNSCERQVLSSNVFRRDLMTVTTRERNWIFLEDIFKSSVLQVQHHADGPYAGARIAISGLPLEGDSPANPQSGVFAELTGRVLAALDEPVPAVPASTEWYDRYGAGEFVNRPELTRENFFHYPGLALGTLCFGGYSFFEETPFVEDLEDGQFNFVCYCIPWKHHAAEGEEVVDWERLEWLIAESKRIGFKLMLDGYPAMFEWGHYPWRQGIVGAHPGFKARYLDALKKIARRVKDEPTVVAMWATSHTGDADFGSFTNDKTPELLAVWHDYLRDKYGTIDKLNAAYDTEYTDFDQVQRPQPGKPGEYNIGKIWHDLLDCHIKTYQAYLRECIETIRSEAPDMPLTVRGAFIDFALTLDVIREYPDIATHCECVETTYDTEAYFRGLSRGFNTYITAENGWPKCPPAALAVSMADYLMGNYSAWTYSFAGPRWVREMQPALQQLAVVREQMGVTEYPTETEIGLLTGDTTLYACNAPSFLNIEKLPHLQPVMEQSGYPFVATSAQFPILEGRKVLLDDGTNRIFTPETRDALIEWLRDGGILIGFPFTGEFSFDGSESFRSVLDLPAGAGEFAIGKGRVIQLEEVPAADPEIITGIFDSLELFQPFGIYPLVHNATVYGRDGKVYLICFDKPQNIWSGFFTESRYAGEIAKVSEKQIIEIRPEIPFTRAVELFTGEELVVENGVIRMELPRFKNRVICFE